MNFTENAKTVLEKRYLKTNKSTGELETIQEMFRRVSDNIALADKKFDENADVQATSDMFYELMTSCKFMPNSPTLMNAGADLQQLSACFVLPIGDSIDEIFESVKNAAIIHKSGGGTGFSFSNLRPKDDIVRTTKGVSSGVVSFMRAFDTATDVVKQGGTRRGANMGMLRVDHPDIMDFINCKKDLSKFNNFNISVAITSEFMVAYETNTDYNLINPRNNEVVGSLNAVEVFENIVNNAWHSGEPGIVFIDVVNEYNPTPKLGKIEATNPCGEQPLLPYEACNLGSINLAMFVNNDGEIEWGYLGEAIHKSIHFLDNVIEMNNYPLPEVEKMVLENRKIGLGVMGFADMLCLMGISYNSDGAEELAKEVMGFIDKEAKYTSSKLAKTRGEFPSGKDLPFGEIYRNATVTTIAPTGTISIICDCSSGIEPNFALAYVKNVMDDSKLPNVNKTFEMIAKREGFYSEEMIREVAKTGSVKGIDSVPQKWQEVFCISHEISPEWHIRIQAAFQKHTDNAVSKTINFPNSATKEEVKEAYLLAYELGCKGVTVYRDGSRDNQVLTVGSESSSTPKAETRENKIIPRERPRKTYGTTTKVNTPSGTLYFTLNDDEQGLCEVFATVGKAGGCEHSQTEGLCRIISLCLRSGVAVEAIAKQLIGIRSNSPVWDNGKAVYSAADAIGNILLDYTKGIKDTKEESNTTSTDDFSTEANYKETCPECDNPLEMSEGCAKCVSCGYSRCS